MGEPIPGMLPSDKPPEGRLDSWKEIAAYLDRDVTTVQRWEKREGMPVYRHVHDKMGSVYAFRADLDAWARSRNLRPARDNGNNTVSAGSTNPAEQPSRSTMATFLTKWKSPWRWQRRELFWR